MGEEFIKSLEEIEEELDEVFSIKNKADVEFEFNIDLIKESDMNKPEPKKPDPKALEGKGITEDLSVYKELCERNGYRQVVTGLTLIGNWAKKINDISIEDKTYDLKDSLKEWKEALPKEDRKKLIKK